VTLRTDFTFLLEITLTEQIVVSLIRQLSWTRSLASPPLKVPLHRVGSRPGRFHALCFSR
jgi:hypothetical protein